jgi:transglutaminase-like putative cysteine protease
LSGALQLATAAASFGIATLVQHDYPHDPDLQCKAKVSAKHHLALSRAGAELARATQLVRRAAGAWDYFSSSIGVAIRPL